MEPFTSRFPELGFKEMLCISVQKGDPLLPPDDYAFAEFYCPDLACDCRRVVIRVVPKSNSRDFLATINFGWESHAFYRAKLHSDQSAREVVCGTLDPLNPQSPLAEALLVAFRTEVLTAAGFVARMEKHYQMFKRAVLQERHPLPSGSKRRKG